MPTLLIRVASILVYNFTGKKRTKKSRHYCFYKLQDHFPNRFYTWKEAFISALY